MLLGHSRNNRERNLCRTPGWAQSCSLAGAAQIELLLDRCCRHSVDDHRDDDDGRGRRPQLVDSDEIIPPAGERKVIQRPRNPRFRRSRLLANGSQRRRSVSSSRTPWCAATVIRHSRPLSASMESAAAAQANLRRQFSALNYLGRRGADSAEWADWSGEWSLLKGDEPTRRTSQSQPVPAPGRRTWVIGRPLSGGGTGSGDVNGPAAPHDREGARAGRPTSRDRRGCRGARGDQM